MDDSAQRAGSRARRSGRSPRTRSVLAATGLLVIGLSPFAVAKTGDFLREGARNGTTTKETEIISKVGAGTGAKGGYATRQSNLSSTGGGAVYGCRANAASTSNPCLRANNLADGRAFDFNARNGLIAGVITAGSGGDTKKPFTTNATGVATGLNADRLDGREAAELIALARAKAGLDADTLDGTDSAELGTRWALINESGEIEQQTGGFSIVNCYSSNANCYIDAGSDVRNKGLRAQIAVANTDGSAILSGETGTAPCGAAFVACAPPNTEANDVIVVAPRASDGTVPGGVTPPAPADAARFYVYVDGATGS
ncbi:MAG: hypothetical protein ACRDKY_09025 [Solirubrobacteraceae bacterium]